MSSIQQSLLVPYGKRVSHSCGYCRSRDVVLGKDEIHSSSSSSDDDDETPNADSPRSQYKSVTFDANALSLLCEDYQRMIDLGWRRSGTFCYKPILSETCCPPNTIRLDVEEFVLAHSQKKILRHFIRDLKVLNNEKVVSNNENVSSMTTSSLQQLERYVSEIESLGLTCTRIRPDENAKLADVYPLFEAYQLKVHQEKSSPQGFERFLVDSPLIYDKNSDEIWGSWHYRYMLHDKLVAVAVCDILPYCLSSVYVFYDPSLRHLNLGTFSALREILFVAEYYKLYPSIRYYYLGFYIRNCPRMTYKAQFRPSQLLDIIENKYVPFSSCDEAWYETQRQQVDISSTEWTRRLNVSRILVEGRVIQVKQLNATRLLEFIKQLLKFLDVALSSRILIVLPL